MANKSRPSEDAERPKLRIAHIEIQNYKALDSIALDLPPPSSPDQLDAFVLGSRNGVGKTSLLECCALALIGQPISRQTAREEFNPLDLLIRGGSSGASVKALLQFGNETLNQTLQIKKGHFEASLRKLDLDDAWMRHLEPAGFLSSLLGMTSEPLILPPVLLFHSYRKVLEGSTALGALVDPAAMRRPYLPRRYGGAGALSVFKIVMVQALMARSGLFEGMEAGEDEVIGRLNELIKEFAGGQVDKLRPGPDGTLDLRITPVGGGESFSVDGLSSGQKEIIATLFLIWLTTRTQPSVVLIDEPELHLNAEWQRLFLHQLARLAPNNQYILATHSEEIFSSVPEDRRLMLSRG
jgi:predicted ATPase